MKSNIKKIDNMHYRNNSLILDNELIEPLYDFGNFPVHMGCVNFNSEHDQFYNMSFSIGTESGVIQLDVPAPLELVYLDQHNDGVGNLWNNHYKEFANFINKFDAKKYLEIGASHDKVAKLVMSNKEIKLWTIIEPNPIVKKTDIIKVIKSWFDYTSKISPDTDIILHSHVLEHVYNPNDFLYNISNKMNESQIHIFSLPNMKKWLDNKFLNCLNFEHTILLTEEILEYLLNINNLEIIDKYYFNDHSIFYATKKNTNIKKINIKNSYLENKKMFNAMIQEHTNFAKTCNDLINKTNSETYIFGAHIFTQFLINLGLNVKKINGIIDHSNLKINKRLYGTPLNVFDESVLKNKDNPNVIIKAGIYTDQIVERLYLINKNINILI